jgi:hypothetical protein
MHEIGKVSLKIALKKIPAAELVLGQNLPPVNP